ncbi:MAG: hypothetical protein ACKVOM_13370 [Ferruginibacter sp.]
MRRKLTYFLIVLSIFLVTTAFTSNEKISGEKILSKMYKKYKGNWHKTFTFTQNTVQYKNDTIARKSIWYETIVYPDYFRISFGDPKDGNAVLFIRDSTFNFAKGKLTGKSKRGEDLTFLLGGMYFLPFDSILVKMKGEGYDISKAFEIDKEGKGFFVIGANNSDEKLNQLWIDKDKLLVAKFIKYDGNSKEEAVFFNHKKFGKAWAETACRFFVNDKLIQTETYTDCKANTAVDMGIFDVGNFK